MDTASATATRQQFPSRAAALAHVRAASQGRSILEMPGMAQIGWEGEVDPAGDIHIADLTAGVVHLVHDEGQSAPDWEVSVESLRDYRSWDRDEEIMELITSGRVLDPRDDAAVREYARLILVSSPVFQGISGRHYDGTPLGVSAPGVVDLAVNALAPGGRLHAVAGQVVMGTPRPLLLAAIADRNAACEFARSQAVAPLELPDLGMYLQPADASGGTVVADLSGGAVYATRQQRWDGMGEYDTAYEVHRITVVDALRDTAQGVVSWWVHREGSDPWSHPEAERRARAAVLEDYGVLMALEVLRELIGKYGQHMPA